MQRPEGKEIYMNYNTMSREELITILQLREKPVRCTEPRCVADYLQEYANCDEEHFVVLVLDGAHQIKFHKVVSVGLANRCLAHPREVFRVAIEHSGVAIIVAHNHPSGVLSPSSDDSDVTARLKHAGMLLGIPLLDHVIFGRGRYHSMSEHGELM